MLLKIIFGFFIGLFLGYILEFFYRSITHKKIIIPKLVNSQMYAFTGVFLFFLYPLKLSLFLELVLIFLFPTIIEFITGYLYLKIKHKYLWDYSKELFNFQKLICLRFSFYWFIISLIFFYLIIPFIYPLL